MIQVFALFSIRKHRCDSEISSTNRPKGVGKGNDYSGSVIGLLSQTLENRKETDQEYERPTTLTIEQL